MVIVFQKQTQVLVAKTHVLGMREREQVSMLQRCWTHGHSLSKANTHVMGMRDTSFYASEMNSMVKSDNRSCLMAIPVFFFTSPEGYKIEVNAAIAGVKGG